MAAMSVSLRCRSRPRMPASRAASCSMAPSGRRRSSSQTDRELVALPRPCPADDTADDHRVGLAGDGVPSGLRGDVDVLGAGSHHPLVVPGKEPHRVRGPRGAEGVDVLAHDVRRGALDVDRDQPVAEPGHPAVEPFAAGAQTVAEPVVDVVERRRPVGPEVRGDGPRTRVVEVGDARPPSG